MPFTQFYMETHSYPDLNTASPKTTLENGLKSSKVGAPEILIHPNKNETLGKSMPDSGSPIKTGNIEIDVANPLNTPTNKPSVIHDLFPIGKPNNSDYVNFPFDKGVHHESFFNLNSSDKAKKDKPVFLVNAIQEKARSGINDIPWSCSKMNSVKGNMNTNMTSLVS